MDFKMEEKKEQQACKTGVCPVDPADAKPEEKKKSNDLHGDDSRNSVRAIIHVGGMSCASCVKRVEDSLSKLSGIYSAAVNFAAEQAEVLFDPDFVSEEDLRKAVTEAGYEVINIRVRKSPRQMKLPT